MPRHAPSLLSQNYPVAYGLKITTALLRRRRELCRFLWREFKDVSFDVYDVIITPL